MNDFIKVKNGISASVAHELAVSESMDAYLASQITRINQCNPYVMSELCALALEVSERSKLTDAISKDSFRASMVTAGIIVYRMLESQAEANALNDLIGE